MTKKVWFQKTYPSWKQLYWQKKVTRNTSSEKHLLLQSLTCNGAENFWRISKEGCSQLSIEDLHTPISQTATLLKEGLYHSCASWETFEDVQNSWNLERLLLRLCKTIVGSSLSRGKVPLIYYLALTYFYLLMFAKVKRTVHFFTLIKMNEKNCSKKVTFHESKF